MVANFAAGGAAINQLARLAGAELQVIPVGQGRPAHDFTRRPAMSEQGCVRAIDVGLAAVPDDIDLLAIGEMGIANTTPAAAIAAALAGEPAAVWAGPGTGLDASGVVAQGGGDRRGARPAPRRDDRPARGAAARRRARAGGDAGCHPGGPAAPRAGAARRLHHHRAGGRAAGDRAGGRSPTARSATARRSPGIGAWWSGSACRRCSTSACGWARPPGPRSRSSSSRAAVACHNGMATFASASVSQSARNERRRSLCGAGFSGGGITGVTGRAVVGRRLDQAGSTPLGGVITPLVLLQRLARCRVLRGTVAGGRLDLLGRCLGRSGRRRVGRDFRLRQGFGGEQAAGHDAGQASEPPRVESSSQVS